MNTFRDKISEYGRFIALLGICFSAPVLFANELATVMTNRNISRADLVKKVKEILSNKEFTGVNTPINNFGDRALHKAVFYGSKELVTLLVNAGANPNQPNNRGFTPLKEAESKGRSDLIAIMTKKEDAPEDATSFSNTLITVATNRNMNRTERLNKVKELINKIIKIDGDVKIINKEINEFGDTMLHKAAYFDDIDLVRALLEAGADAFKANNKGFSALDDAKEFGYDKIVEALKEGKKSETPKEEQAETKKAE